MSPLASIGIAVLMHVAWNLLARRNAPDRHFLWWAVLAHIAMFAPLTGPNLIAALEAAPHLAYAVLATGVANGFYFISLRHAYRLAPAGVVYPLARSAPLLVAVGEILLFGRLPSLVAWIGITLGVAGLWLVALDRGSTTGIARALPFTAGAALMTGVYSLSDKYFAQQYSALPDTLGFVSVTFVIAWLILSLEMRITESRWVPADRPPTWAVLIGGATTGVAYALVIHAMGSLPAAYAVTLANGGVVLTVILGIFLLGETDGWRRRLCGAVASATGMGLIAFAANSPP